MGRDGGTGSGGDDSCGGRDGEGAGPWWKRVGWLLLIWCAGVAALAVFAFGLRLLMRAAGLSA